MDLTHELNDSDCCNNTNYTTDLPDDCDYYHYYLELVQTYVIPSTITFGLTGNFFSSIIFLTTNLRKRSSSMYLGALSIADFGFLSVLAIVNLSYYAEILDIYNIELFCQTFVYVSTVCSNVGVWLIVAFTAERFIAVQFPLKRQFMCTVSRAKMIIFCIVFVQAVSQLYIFWAAGIVVTEISNYEEKRECEMLESFHEYMTIINIIDTIFSLIIPIFLIVFFNTMIARALFRFKKKLFKVDLSKKFENEESSKYTSSIKTSGTKSTGMTGSSQSSKQDESTTKSNFQLYNYDSDRNFLMIKSQRSITKMLLIISSVFIFLNVPSYALRLYIFSMDIMQKDMKSIWCMQQLAMTLYYMNYSINFLLYSMCGVTFRNAFGVFMMRFINKLTKRCKCCGKK